MVLGYIGFFIYIKHEQLFNKFSLVMKEIPQWSHYVYVAIEVILTLIFMAGRIIHYKQ